MRPKSVVLSFRKKLQVLEKNLFRKKICLAYLCGYDIKNEVWIFKKKINGSQDI